MTLDEYKKRHLTIVVDNTDSIEVVAGPAGERGEKGDKGDPGVSDIPGPQGPQGVPGKDGVDGKDGLLGKDGTDGKDGEQGPAGIQGLQGEPGKDGKDGLHGVDGKDGLPGKDGVDGAPGIQGLQGLKGDTGAIGSQGIQGVAGPKGDTGAQGIQGLPGKDGKDGLPGAAGKDGKDGAAGPQGVAGSAGAQGLKGDKGDTGPVGTSGAMNTITFTAPVVNNVTAVGSIIATYTFTSKGYPVLMIANGDANPVGAGSQWTQVQWFRDGIAIGNKFHMESVASNINVSYCLTTNDTPSAGSHTYTLRIVNGLAGVWNFGEAAGPQLTFVELSGAVGPQGPAGIGIPGFASARVDDGVPVTLDNIMVQLNTGKPRSLQFKTVTGTLDIRVSGIIYWNPGTGNDNVGANTWGGTTLNTTWQLPFGWDFPWGNDWAQYMVQDKTNGRYYRITLSIGDGYKGNFIVMERLV